MLCGSGALTMVWRCTSSRAHLRNDHRASLGDSRMLSGTVLGHDRSFSKQSITARSRALTPLMLMYVAGARAMSERVRFTRTKLSRTTVEA